MRKSFYKKIKNVSFLVEVNTRQWRVCIDLGTMGSDSIRFKVSVLCVDIAMYIVILKRPRTRRKKTFINENS